MKLVVLILLALQTNSASAKTLELLCKGVDVDDQLVVTVDLASGKIADIEPKGLACIGGVVRRDVNKAESLFFCDGIPLS